MKDGASSVGFHRRTDQEIPPALLMAVKTVIAALDAEPLTQPLLDSEFSAASNVTMLYAVLLERPSAEPLEPTLSLSIPDP